MPADLTPTDAALLDRWAGALARLAEGPTEYGPHDVGALAATTERMVVENARLRAELSGLRAYLTRSIANDLGGMDEAFEILGSVSAQDREMVDAWAREMSDPAYWSKEVDRLRAIAGNTDATPNEALMLNLVRGTPGLLAREYGAMFAKVDPTYPTNDPNQWIIGNNAKHLSALHRKGLVHREQAGQTYRYWVADA